MTVALSEAPNWVEIKQKKAVVELDGKVIDMAFVMAIDPIAPDDEKADTAMAYAKAIPGPLGVVAVERVSTYERKNGRMQISKLVRWINNFSNTKHTLEKGDTFLDLYLASGGEM